MLPPIAKMPYPPQAVMIGVQRRRVAMRMWATCCVIRSICRRSSQASLEWTLTTPPFKKHSAPCSNSNGCVFSTRPFRLSFARSASTKGLPNKEHCRGERRQGNRRQGNAIQGSDDDTSHDTLSVSNQSKQEFQVTTLP